MFFSSAVLEDITAISTKGKSAIDVSTGEIAFSIPIRSFQFNKSLMQEHFNDKYMESEEFPKASFIGVIEGWKPAGSIKHAVAKGELTIHGITKQLESEGSVIFKNNKLIIEAEFNVRLEDFGIEVPSLMFKKIAEVVKVTLFYEYPVHEN